MLTRSGKAAALLTAALFVVGFALRYVELLIVGAAFLTVIVIAALWMISRPKLDARREVRPVRVVEGKAATAVLTVTNRSRRRSPSMVALETFGDTVVPVAVPSLEPGATFSRPYKLPTDRRGVYQVGPLLVSRSDPFAFVRFGQRQRSFETLWVHPATYSVTPFPAGQAHDLDGPTSGAAPRGGVAFHTLREYVRGDDLRLIHWKSSARTGTLVVRHNVDTNQPRTLVVLDTRSDVYTEDSFDDAVRCAASIVVACAANRFPVRLRTTDGLTLSAERGARVDTVLDQLAGLARSPTAGLANIAAQAAGERGGLSLAVITGQSTASDLVAVGPLRARFESVTIGRIGVSGRGRVHELPGAVLINAETAADWAQAWNRRVRR
ncbi:MAG: DUF58 domain-containing protein [Acidimicrobiales bacterium]